MGEALSPRRSPRFDGLGRRPPHTGWAMAKLRLLGGFTLEHPERGPVEVATGKGRALLAYLACAKGNTASRESLALLLWSDSDSRKSRQNLRQVLFKLSRTLAGHDLPIVLIGAQTVALRTGDLWVDTWELDSLTSSDSLPALGELESFYQGEFLQGMALDAPVFADWLAEMRAHHQNRALNCLHTLLEIRREAGHLNAAIAAGLRALEIDSSQEQIHRALMELYLASGKRGAALNQYRTCRSVLLRDLDVVPDETTEELYRRIRDCKADSRPRHQGSPGVIRSEPAGGPMENPAPATFEPPNGRGGEIKALHDALTEACSHGARLFALNGEAGIGKTHLLDTFTKHLAGQGCHVRTVTARQAERRLSLGLWRQVLEILPPPRRSIFPPGQDGLREVPMPYGVRHEDAAGSPPPHAQGDGLFDAALEGLKAAAAQGPVVLILEDIQWADAESLRRLGRAVHSLRHAPVLFVTAARLWPEMAPARFAPVMEDLERAGLIRHCDLGPLSFNDSMTLLKAAMAARGQSNLEARQRKQLWKYAEGNPEILVAGLVPSARRDTLQLPRNLRLSARHTMDRMPSSAKILIQIACLAHGLFGPSIFARAAGLEVRKVAATLEQLASGKLLRQTGGNFSIARAWFRKAVYDDLPQGQHRAMHGAIASAIRAVEAPDLESHYDALAYHCRAAGENLAAADYRLRALELSLARGARRGVSKALKNLARCMPERPRDPKMNAVFWRAGFLRAAIADADADPAATLLHLRALEKRGPRDDDPRAAVALSYALSRACCVAGDGDEGLRYARRTLHLSAGQSGTEGPWKLPERLLFRCYLHAPAAAGVISGLKARAQQARVKNAWTSVGEIVTAQAMMEGMAGRFAAMRDSFEIAREAVARRPEPWAQASYLQIDGMARNWTGGGLKAIADLGKALALTGAGGDLIRSCVNRGLRGQAYIAHGFLEEAKSDLEQAIDEATALGPIPYLPLFYCWLAEVSGRSGRHGDAIEQARHAWRLSYGQGQSWTRATILRALARGFAHARRPNIAAAERVVREAIATHRSMGIRVGLANSYVAHAEIRRAAGDPAGSQALFRQARDLRRSIGIKATAIESRGRIGVNAGGVSA